MKNRLLFLLALAAALSACQPDDDALIGTWKADKVNVQFDEQHSTPALVKQIGEMEQGNTFTIAPDSTLTFKGLDEQWQGRLSLRSDGTLLFDGTAFGTWSHGRIVTRTESPVGEVTVTYKKE